MPIQIMEASAGDQRWLDFCEKRPETTLFQSPGWSSVIERTYGFSQRVLLALDGDTVVGGLPFSHIDDFRGSRRVALAFADNLEPLPEALWPPFEAWIAQDSLPWNIRTRAIPSALAASSRHAAMHHSIRLPATYEEAAARFHYKHVQNIKQAAKAGLTFRRERDSEGVEVFYELHSAVRKNKHALLPQPHAFFHHIRDVFYPDNGFVLLAEHEGRVVSAMFFVAYKKTLYYKFSASALDALLLRPNHYLISKAIEVAILDGFEILDLGISDTEGLIRFKDRIGGEAHDVHAASYNPREKTDAIAQVERTFGALTNLLTSAEYPLSAAQRGGDLLYRFFT